jgi:integrase
MVRIPTRIRTNLLPPIYPQGAGGIANTINRLTAIKVQRLKEGGMYPDGAGLYLQVTGKSAKSWVFRYSLRGGAREMGLGSLSKVSLAEARDERDKYNRLLRDHIDPIEDRKRRRNEAALTVAKSITFTQAAAAYIAAHRAGLKSTKHAKQWVTTIATYAEPRLGKLNVADIDTGLIAQVLEPIWTTKTETAGRVRGRIECILDWAQVKGYRTGENPARWRGRLDKLFAKQSKVRQVKHHAAMPYDALPEFMAKLRQKTGSTARALEFCILCAARSGEVLTARPSEIAGGVWTVPGERMKGGQTHRVPLSKRASEVASGGSGSYLFPSPYHPDKPLSNMAMLMLLQYMGHDDVTVHGFRSSFKDWCRDRTRFDNYVVEAALAHASGDRVERAYARSDVLEKRRQLMDAWAQFCATPPAKSADRVVPLRQAQ